MPSRLLVTLVVALPMLTRVPPGAAADAPPTTAAAATTSTTIQPPAEQQTKVNGTLPDLTGHWLVVVWVDIPGDQHRTSTAMWDVTAHEGRPVVTTRFVDLPERQQIALSRANTGNAAWRPEPADVRAVAARWDDLPAQNSHPASIVHILTGRDAFDATFTSEPAAKDAVWVMQQNDTMAPGAAPAVRQITVYGAVEQNESGWTGNYLSTLIATAPFPIPITLKGHFQAFRLVAPPPRGPLGSLLDQLSGCGRSR
jgi:hypothetical protein